MAHWHIRFLDKGIHLFNMLSFCHFFTGLEEAILDFSETIVHNDAQTSETTPPSKRKRTHKDINSVKEMEILHLEKDNFLLQKQYLNLKITVKKQELKNLLLQEKIMKAQLEKLPQSDTENEI